MGDLCINGLVVEYPNGGEAIRAIDGLDLKITAGSLAVVLGPSGCGKTTLLSCLGGILSPTAGRIEFGDVEVTALDRRQLTAHRRHNVGIVFQSFNLVASLTALENVMVPMWAAGWPRRAARDRARELLTRFGLQDRMTHRPGDLSGGQQQRVAVARALALDPPLILADEPTAHLDFAQAEEVLGLLRELATGERIVVVATHDTRILPLADRVIELTPPFTSTDREPETVTLAGGSVLFEQGSIGELIYLVSDGELAIVRESSDGAQPLKVATPGDYVGGFEPLLRLPRLATVYARTDATVVGYSVQAFRERLGIFTERHPIEYHEIDIEDEAPLVSWSRRCTATNETPSNMTTLNHRDHHAISPSVLRPVDHPVPDLAAAEQAAGAFLAALGVSVNAESTRDTPARMARAYAELLTAEPFEATTFPNDEGYDELVLARDIPLRSVCEHHLLPFTGTACVGYLPGDRILGLSKLARVVEHFACRPQVQERLTKQVADWFTDHLQPRAVGVVIRAEHTCMTLRGVHATGSTTVTSALLGTLRSDPGSRQEFFALAGIGT